MKNNVTSKSIASIIIIIAIIYYFIVSIQELDIGIFFFLAFFGPATICCCLGVIKEEVFGNNKE